MNFISSAAGSVREARALVYQQLGTMKVTSANSAEVQELIIYAKRLEDLQSTLEVISHRYSEMAPLAPLNGSTTAVRTSSSPRMSR